MDVAVVGDRASSLSVRLGAQTYLFAVADGFGEIDGDPAAKRAVLKLRDGMERRARRERLRRNGARPKVIGDTLAGALREVNAHLQARSASHADYVTAATSVTALLVVDDRAFVAHAGSTSAYLVRRSRGVALTTSDTFCDESALPVLTRALGLAPTIDLSVSSFSLNLADLLVLRTSTGDRSLIVRYDSAEPALRAQSMQYRVPPAVTALGATVLFYALLCLR